jgi:hypothetical protein
MLNVSLLRLSAPRFSGVTTSTSWGVSFVELDGASVGVLARLGLSPAEGTCGKQQEQKMFINTYTSGICGPTCQPINEPCCGMGKEEGLEVDPSAPGAINPYLLS